MSEEEIDEKLGSVGPEEQPQEVKQPKVKRERKKKEPEAKVTNDEVIQIDKSSIWKIAGVAVVLIAVIAFLVVKGGDDTPPQGNVPPTKNVPKDINMVNLAGDDPMLGKPEAKVTIIEFSDYQCPFCGRFYTQTLPEIKKNYIDTGKVKLIFKDLPLTQIHPFAQKAAEASECADDQGKFWDYHNKLFENQQALTLEDLKKYAKDLGLDETQFNTCLETGKYQKEVNDDMLAGVNIGITGTPSFVINGVLLEGAQPYVAFQAEIEKALNS